MIPNRSASRQAASEASGPVGSQVQDAVADDDLADDPRVVEVVEAYLRDVKAGRAPDRRQFIDRYPELSSVVEECLDGLELVCGNGSAGSGLPNGPSSQQSRSGAAAHAASVSTGELAQPLGDFQIIRELARGGMGVVYEAVQLSLGRRVALKVLPFAATLDSRQLQRFKLEAQAAALLHHTHIVPIHAVGCERGVHFYAMQLIEGQSLAVVIRQLREKDGRFDDGSRSAHVLDNSKRRRGISPQSGITLDQAAVKDPPIPGLLQPVVAAAGMQAVRVTVDVSASMTAGTALDKETYIRRAARLMVQAAAALEHAHQSGVVHRDIKPANLLLDASGNLWVADFGLAQLQTDNGLTRSGDMLGTVRYMSPEQAGGQKTTLDHRTDIYSLGATFYELLTLEPAFPGETQQELLYQILETEPTSLKELNRGVPPELETIILKALSKAPAERYRTAAEFGADIQRYLDHQPILARRPSLLDRTRKWSRRHPAVVIATVLLMMVIASASLISNRLIAIEQQKTKDSLEREKLRAQEAEQQFRQARQAVDALLQISEEELSMGPGENARRRILELVLGYYQNFIEQRRGDAASQADLAKVQDKVKGILNDLDVLQRDLQTLLLDYVEVRKALTLDASQEANLQARLKEWGDERRVAAEHFRNLNEAGKKTLMIAQAEKHDRALAEVLKPAQLQRLKQIGLQWQGLFAFRDNAEVQRLLKFTSEQRLQIREIVHDFFTSNGRRGPRGFGFGPGGPAFGKPPEGPGRDGPGGHGPDGRGEPGGPHFEGRKDHRGPKEGGAPWERGPRDGRPDDWSQGEWIAKVLAILTPEQVKQWNTLVGEPFVWGRPEAAAKVP